MLGGGKGRPLRAKRERGGEVYMRFMISARIPNEKLNALIKEGTFPQTFMP